MGERTDPAGERDRPAFQPNQETSDHASKTPRLESSIGRRLKISLTMIVRDESANLSACLDSAVSLFDEIVVVDTGSTDDSTTVARTLGARVFDFVWVDDFAAARNAALARATGDYVFWLDARDRLESNERAGLSALLAGLASTDAAYIFRRVADVDPHNLDFAEVAIPQVRLVPLRSDVRWSYPVRERIEPALRAVGIALRPSHLTIRQVAPIDPRHRCRAIERDVRILTSALQERPDDPFLLFHLGELALERRDPRRALNYLEACLLAGDLDDSLARRLHPLRARGYQMMAEPTAALAACAAGRALAPDDVELLVREGLVRRWVNDVEGAVSCWRRALAAPQSDAARPHVLEARRQLARLAEERGSLAEAARLWADVLAECPQDAEAASARSRIAEIGGHSGGEPR